VIISSPHALPVGSRHTGLSDSDAADHPDQPFVVLRVATLDEWAAEARADGVGEADIHYTAGSRHHFYDVSVD
jgi:hypothetical protein